MQSLRGEAAVGRREFMTLKKKYAANAKGKARTASRKLLRVGRDVSKHSNSGDVDLTILCYLGNARFELRTAGIRPYTLTN